MNILLELATLNDLGTLIPFVRAYHEFEEIESTPQQLEEALIPLLATEHAGRVWFINLDNERVGYVALCFGYSIEFRGRDAFIDELYIVSEQRGKGVGKDVLRLLGTEAKALGVKTLHLEVAYENNRAKHLYETVGFEARDRYTFMSKEL
jgi:ribosomal protein S18 acetylase RimI-like enzyme